MNKEILHCPFCLWNVELIIKRDNIRTLLWNSFDCLCWEIKCKECDIWFNYNRRLSFPKVYKLKKAEKEKVVNDYYNWLKDEIKAYLIEKWQWKRIK